MLLSLTQVKRIATDVARAHDPRVEVVGATISSGGSPYTEVTMTVHDSQAQPYVIVVGAERDEAEAQLRSTIAAELRQRLDDRRAVFQAAFREHAQ
jgi:hypothetical protein